MARPARVRFVTVLPKTRSGKLLRRAIQAICEGRDAGDLTTMEDPAALQQIKDKGYAQKYLGRGEPVHLIGVEFSKASRNIVRFEVQTLAPDAIE